VSIEPGAQLEIAATDTEVVRAFASVVYVGEMDTCPARLSFTASGDDVRRNADGQFVLAMSGAWHFNWTVRPAPNDPVCRTQHVRSEPVSFEVTIALQGEYPAVIDGGILPVPAAAATTTDGTPPTTTTMPAGTDGESETTLEEAEEPDEEAAAPAATSTTSPDEDEGGALVGFIIAVAVILGVGAAVLLFKRLFAPESPLQQAARRRTAYSSDQAAAEAASAWFRTEATHVIPPGTLVTVPNPAWVEKQRAAGDDLPPSVDAPLPLGLTLKPGVPASDPWTDARVTDGLTIAYDFEHLHRGALRTGAVVMVNEDDLTPLAGPGFTPAHQLTETVERRKGTGPVAVWAPGTKVQVLETTGDWTLVRTNKDTSMWVSPSSLEPLEPPPSPSGPPPPPPPSPPG
jgi:hypothetical protein